MSQPLFSRLQNGLALLDRRTVQKIRFPQPVATLTFDDFPASAYTVGGALLKNAGVKASYFVSGEYANSVIEGVEYYSPGHLKAVYADGHEIGCHAFYHSHLPVFGAKYAETACDKNALFVRDVLGKEFGMTSFAYPFGDVSPTIKTAMKKRFSLCRSIKSGINKNSLDSALIRAISLENHLLHKLNLKSLIDETLQKKGWLVFYTHDISSSPTDYGTPPEALDKILQALKTANIPVMTLKAAAARITSGDIHIAA